MRERLITLGLILLIAGGFYLMLSLDKGQEPVGPALVTDTATKESAVELKLPFEFAGDTLPLADITAAGYPLILDFGASWCPPCKVMKPFAKQIYTEYKGKAVMLYVDVDEHAAVVGEYPVKVVPTQFLYGKDGKAFNPPADVWQTYGLIAYKDASGNLINTGHEGILSYEDMKVLFDMMLQQ